MNELEISEKAVNNFVNDSYNCAEAIMAAVSESKGIEKNSFTSFATAFGGGIGSKGHICGALTGGLMALGWLAKDKGLQKPEIRERSGKLYDEFHSVFGSTLCSVLTSHSCDSSKDDYDIKNCAPYIRFVVSEILNED